MKKTICLLLSLILAFSFLQLSIFAAADGNDLPFSYTVYPEKQEYQKGESIGICVSIVNTTLDEITDMRLWMDYPLTDYYLTPGATEKFFTSVTERADKTMRVAEDEGVLEFASKFSNVEFLNKFFLRLAHAYKSLTLFYTTVKYGLENSFVSINQTKAELGSVKVKYDGTEIEFSLKCRFSVKKSAENEVHRLMDSYVSQSAEIRAVGNSFAGLAFAVSVDKSDYGLFVINPDYGRASVYRAENGKYHLLGTKQVSIEEGKTYKMKTFFDGGRVICWLYDNPRDTDPYPVFDMHYDSQETGCGVFAQKDGYSKFSISSEAPSFPERAYTNPVHENTPDPYILIDNGTYYLYATTDPYTGYRVFSSTDLVNWENPVFCASKGDIIGETGFWAPEVYRYNGKYWMLYSVDEHLALASADSPTGPFVKTSDNYLFEEKCIDGHLLFDDDGSVYLYMAYWGESGEEIWGCRMARDLSGADRSTLTQLTSCKENEGGVNEGPFMLKYKDKYYLTYSVNGYTNPDYSVKLAVSDSPLGTYESRGTILEKSGPLVGTGHHCFTASPDGTELFIAYHCHYSATRVHARKLCIDRCKFTETDDGYTISVYGPTSTPQPYPSDNG